MIGKTLGQYEILEHLGAGGMGAVYRAKDTNLKRDVAIKVLPEALANDEDRLARLRREAQLLASVNHPNIATIYNLEQSADTRWLVLELVDGTTLEQKLRSGPMSVADSLRIGIQIASALEAAHEKGIVHRDLKAANVMLDAKRRVKVLDFGIAKDVSGSEGAQSDAETLTHMTADFTAEGVIVGTAPYMSPEQIRGHAIDKRSDNWAFGCLMFELLTGKRPFDRDTVMDTLSAVLEHEPDWNLLPEDTPEDMEAVIRRCLRKDADVRLRDIGDVRVEFGEIETATAAGITATRRRTASASASVGWPTMKVAATVVGLLITVGAAGWGLWSTLGTEPGAEELPELVVAPVPDVLPTPNAIAVRPFRAIPDDAENQALADGLAEEVWSRLSKVSGLRTTEPRSSFQAKGTLAEIGQELGVSKILDGSVQRDGDELIVRVQLTDLDGGFGFTGEYPGTLETASVFEIQRDIALRVVGALGVELVGDEAALLASRPTENLSAYGVYLEGRASLRSRTRESLESATRLFGQAAALDPEFVLAHLGVADAQILLAQYGGLTPDEVDKALIEAQMRVDTAQPFDPGIGQLHKVQGAIYGLTSSDLAGPALKLATERNPNDSASHNYYGTFLRYSAQDRVGARAEFEKARALGPLEAPPYENLARLLLEENHLQDALSMATKAVDLDPGYPFAHWIRGEVLLKLGRGDLALEHFDKMVDLNSYDDVRLRYVANAFTAVGLIDAAEEVHLWRMEIAPENPNRHMQLGDFYRQVGRFDAAAAAYRLAIDLDPRPERGSYRSRMVGLELDRDDVTAAERLVAEIEAAVAAVGRTPETSQFFRAARLNLDMYRGQYADSVAMAQTQASGFPVNGYERYRDSEPVGYIGVLAGSPENSRQFFEAKFPALLQDANPSISGNNLTPAIDLAAVLVRTDEQERAELLLRKSEEFLDPVAPQQRRNQFRTARMEIYALQGRTDEALDALRLAIDDGWRAGWWRLEHKPHFDSIRDDPRFQEMVEELRAAVTK